MKKETGVICFKPTLDLNLLTDTFTDSTTAYIITCTYLFVKCFHRHFKATYTFAKEKYARKITAQEHNRQLQCSGVVLSNGGAPLTMDSLLAGEPPPPDFGQSDGKSVFSEALSFSRN